MASVALVKRHVWNVLSNAFLSPYVTIKWRRVVRQGVLLCWVIAAFDTHVHIQEARASPLLCCVRSDSCAHKHWKSRLPKRCCPWVHLLGWRPAITFLGSVRKRHDYSLRPLLPGGVGDYHFFPAISLLISTASFLHCIKWDDYINRHYID